MQISDVNEEGEEWNVEMQDSMEQRAACLSESDVDAA